MKKLVILHVCYIDNNKCNGVSNVVPEYYLHQKKYCKIGLLNCTSIKVESLKQEENVFLLNDYECISRLPKPFNHPDLIVFHEVYKKKYPFLYSDVKKHNVPYIIIPHGCLTEDAQRIRRTKKRIFNKLFFDKFINNAASIQFLSQREKEMSEKYAKKSFISGNGVKLIEYKKTKKDKDVTKLVYIGRYSIYHKGLDLLLSYCNDCQDYMRQNGIVVNLYGTGDECAEKWLNDYVKKNSLSDIVVINGPVFDETKEKILTKSDYFIQLSRLEGQPLGLMEALANGIPVIISDGTTFGDYIRSFDCGFSCNNAIDFINILKTIKNMDKDTYDEKAIKATGLMKEGFDWNTISRSTVRKYCKIINNTGVNYAI